MKISFKYIANVLLFGAVYCFTSILSVWLHHMQGISPFWPSAGLAVAIIYLGGYRYWLSILFGTAAMALLLSTPFSLFILDSVIQIGEAFIVVYLLRRFTAFSTDFGHIKDILYLLLAIGPAILFIALVQILAFFVMGIVLDNDPAVMILMLMVSHVIGILVVTPLVLVWKRPYPILLSTKEKIEVLALFVAGVAIQSIDLNAFSTPSLWYIPLMYLISPFTLWAILRFHAYGATAVSLFIAILLATTNLQNDVPSFVPVESLIKASVMGITAIVALMIAAVLTERENTRTALLRSQKQLQEQLSFSQTIMDTLGQGVFVVNLDERLEYVNPAYANTIGYDSDELIGQSPKNFIPDSYKHKYDEAVVQRMDGITSTYESELRHKNGDTIPVLVTGAPRWENGRVTGSIVINTDLTERKRAQEMVHLIVSKSPNTTLIINQKGKIVFTNDLVQEMFGYSPSDLIGQSFHILLPDRFRHTHHEQEKTYHAQPASRKLGIGRILSAQHRDGHEFQAEIALNPVETNDGNMVLVTVVDITPRMKMEQKLQQRESYLRILVEQAPIGIIIADMDGIVTDANPYSIKLLGSPSREKTIGLNLLILPPLVKAGLSDAFRDVIVSGEMVEKEVWYTSIWDKRIYIFLRTVPHRNENNEQIGILVLIEDMTARVQAEEAMLHLQKTESLGILAGGIAHDFNNLLVAIMAQSSLALLKMDDDVPARVNVEKSNSAAKRAAELTNQLLAYSGRGRFHISRLNMNDLIKENNELFTATIPKHIKLTQSLMPDLPFIEVDISQIQQVIMNLIINAAEAIGEVPGTVHLTTDIKMVGENDSHYGQYVTGLLETGHYVRLEVRDTGSGMDAETVKKIFDPFFSTKETGHGLGLAAVLGIINGHRGALSVYSDENGTIFNLLFPVSTGSVIMADHAANKEELIKNDDILSGMVLIIDDEETVCVAVTDILSLNGIETVSAHNGRDGVALYQRMQDDIALIVLDLSMPGWGGQRTLKALRAIDPQVCIILSTGYSKEDAVQRFDEEVPSAFLSKPYNADELLESVTRNWPSSSNAGERNK